MLMIYLEHDLIKAMKINVGYRIYDSFPEGDCFGLVAKGVMSIFGFRPGGGPRLEVVDCSLVLDGLHS